MFRSPQVNLYTRDMSRALAFYRDLGFVETFRYPKEGSPEHVELQLDGFVLGIATEETARANHGLSPDLAGHSVEFVLWTDDVDAAIDEFAARGATVLSRPHDWLENLRIAWVSDSDGNPIQIVANRG
jgi:predicted enzyme related to lactoylglutathione lyase